MKLVIAGSRSLVGDETLIAFTEFYKHFDSPGLIICGCSPEGVDREGWKLARLSQIPVEYFPAWPSQAGWAMRKQREGEVIHSLPESHWKWELCGFVRNEVMAVACDAALIVWDGESTGTADMIKHVRRLGKPGLIWTVGGMVEVL